jgi:hypothetical protein
MASSLKKLLSNIKNENIDSDIKYDSDMLSSYDIANITYPKLEYNINNWNGNPRELTPTVEFNESVTAVRILLYRPNCSYVPIKYSYPIFNKYNEQYFNYVIFGVRTFNGEFWIVPYSNDYIYRPTYITCIGQLLIDKINMVNVPSQLNTINYNEPDFDECMKAISILKKKNNYGINIKTILKKNINHTEATDLYYIYRKNDDIWILHFNQLEWYEPYIYITLPEFNQIEKNAIQFVNLI